MVSQANIVYNHDSVEAPASEAYVILYVTITARILAIALFL